MSLLDWLPFSLCSSLRLLVPVQRALQPHRTTEHSLLRPPPPIRPPPVSAAKVDWAAAAPSGLWTGLFGSFPFLFTIYGGLWRSRTLQNILVNINGGTWALQLRSGTFVKAAGLQSYDRKMKWSSDYYSAKLLWSKFYFFKYCWFKNNEGCVA